MVDNIKKKLHSLEILLPLSPATTSPPPQPACACIFSAPIFPLFSLEINTSLPHYPESLSQTLSPKRQSSGTCIKWLQFSVLTPQPCENRVISPLVFSNQLPRRNDFYYMNHLLRSLSQTGESLSFQFKSGCSSLQSLWCLGPKMCSRYHQAHYCSKEHQALDWRLRHKQACEQTENLDNTIPDHNFLFPEFEIVIAENDYT